MPLQLIQADITKIEVDAVVNATNRHLLGAGRGVDYAIHTAAGPMLQSRLNQLEPCEMGHVVVTESFQMDNCRMIIHAVPPVYGGGVYGERELLESCYREVLAAAVKAGCARIAVPILGAGANGYPRAAAYAIAVKVFRAFFAEYESDLTVFLVLYTNEMLEISRRYSEETDFGSKELPAASIAAPTRSDLLSYREQEEQLLYEEPMIERGNSRYLKKKRRNLEKTVNTRPTTAPAFSSTDFWAPIPEATGTVPDYLQQDLSFAEMCIWWYERKGIPVGEFYSRANISRATFSNMKTHPDRTPKITTAAACAIALRLTRAETDDLLMRAGLALSRHHPVDQVIIRNIAAKNYDIDDINMQLFSRDLSLLGSTN